MATMILLSEEVAELRLHGEAHGDCPRSGRLILVSVSEVNRERLGCDGCGYWGPWIEDGGPVDAPWNAPAPWVGSTP
jgi:hypothetical protein